MPSNSPDGFLPTGGNYKDLFTFPFCERHLKRGARTIDQMVQTARSGKQNIAEGSKASIISTGMELKLNDVARASLEELPIYYQDYLRVRDPPILG